MWNFLKNLRTRRPDPVRRTPMLTFVIRRDDGEHVDLTGDEWCRVLRPDQGEFECIVRDGWQHVVKIGDAEVETALEHPGIELTFVNWSDQDAAAELAEVMRRRVEETTGHAAELVALGDPGAPDAAPVRL